MNSHKPFFSISERSELLGGQFWPNSTFFKLPAVTLTKISNNLLSFRKKETERSRKQRAYRVMKTYLNTEAIDLFFAVTTQSMVLISLPCFKLNRQHSTENESLKVVKL